MAKPGIQYKHPWIYSLFIKLIHRPKVIETFRQRVGQNVSVFDIAAGFGRMAGYLDSGNTYKGIDLNPVYVAHAQKQGLNVTKGDIFDAKNYTDHDVTIMVDVVHHMPEAKLTELFNLIFKHAQQRVVIMEPAFVNLEKKFGPLARPVDWALRKLDSDGVNDIERWLTEKEYRRLFESKFSSPHGRPFTMRLEKVYPYYVVTFTKR